MPVRAIFIFEGGEMVREPWHGSGSMIQYPDPPRQVPMRRLRTQSSVTEGMTYEVYAEPSIPEAEAMRRVRAWNQQFPSQAVPPVGAVFK